METLSSHLSPLASPLSSFPLAFPPLANSRFSSQNLFRNCFFFPFCRIRLFHNCLIFQSSKHCLTSNFKVGFSVNFSEEYEIKQFLCWKLENKYFCIGFKENVFR